MTEALLFAAIGPNPASLSEAVWALHRQRDVRVVGAHLVSLSRGNHYLFPEFLAPEAALDQLRAVLPGVLDQAAVKATVVRRPDGSEVESDLDPADADLYRDATWVAARSCVEAAGDRPVVFLLAGGRQRTTTAYAVTLFQLLAREQDLLLDVRVSDRRAEGGAGFFFPEQRHQQIQVDGGVLDARTVEVHLVEVAVPRLRPLLPTASLESFPEALDASRGAIDRARPPRLRVDLSDDRKPTMSVGGLPARMPMAPLVWLAALAAQRLKDPEPDGGWLPVSATELIPKLLPGIEGTKWMQWRVRADALRDLFGLTPLGERFRNTCVEEGERLKAIRADARKKLGAALDEAGHPEWAPWVVPEVKRSGDQFWQRLALPADLVDLVLPRPGAH